MQLQQHNNLKNTNKNTKGKKMENSTDRRGGARKGCGRKPIDPSEQKIQLFFYVKRKNADAFRAAVEKLLKKYNR